MKIKKFFSEKSISNSIIPGGILVVILVCFGFMFVGLSDVSRDPSLAQVGNVMLGCAGIIAVAIWLVCTVFLCLGFLWDKDGHSALVNGKCWIQYYLKSVLSSVADFFVLKKNQLSLAFPSQIPTLKAILLYPTETKMPKPTDLLAQIQESIKKADLKASFSKKGEILELRDGVATVVGLDNAMFSEIVEFENHTKGLILDLSADKVGVLILGDAETLKQGDTVQTLGVVLSIPVGEEYLGRVVDGLGNPIDWGAKITSKERGLVEKIAPWVMTRETVNIPLETWIKAIDAMTPIGRGQRELIIGDRQIGKTTIALDTILHQKGKEVITIYVAIGQKDAKVKQLVETLKERDAMSYTIVVNAPSSSPAVMQYLAPYVWCTLGEYFMDQGKDVLIVYDDLTKHAVAYREISLLLRRPPGREAYPWDIFYLHSRLLERAAKLNKANGGGSLTALPIVETLDSDISAYIPTNIISITDGQIFLETELFNSGMKPAIDVGLSVSRVGGNAQTKLMKKVAGKLRIQLATFRELANFMQFGSDLDEETYQQIEKGKRLTEMLKQKNANPIPFYKQAVLIYAGVNDYLNEIPLTSISAFEESLYLKMDKGYKALAKAMLKQQDLTEEIEKEMKMLIKEVVKELTKVSG